jgi:hypothetical protein
VVLGEGRICSKVIRSEELSQEDKHGWRTEEAWLGLAWGPRRFETSVLREMGDPASFKQRWRVCVCLRERRGEKKGEREREKREKEREREREEAVLACSIF